MTGEESVYDSDRVLDTEYSFNSIDEDMLRENIIVINPTDTETAGKLKIIYNYYYNYYFTLYLL